MYKALHISIHDFPGLKVVEVAHDMQLAVERYVKQDLKLLNSFDTWHGMKLTAMVQSLCLHWCNSTPCRNQERCQGACKITKGRVRDQDVTWFTELADKRMSLVCTM